MKARIGDVIVSDDGGRVHLTLVNRDGDRHEHELWASAAVQVAAALVRAAGEAMDGGLPEARHWLDSTLDEAADA